MPYGKIKNISGSRLIHFAPLESQEPTVLDGWMLGHFWKTVMENLWVEKLNLFSRHSLNSDPFETWMIPEFEIMICQGVSKAARFLANIIYICYSKKNRWSSKPILRAGYKNQQHNSCKVHPEIVLHPRDPKRPNTPASCFPPKVPFAPQKTSPGLYFRSQWPLQCSKCRKSLR